jgi:RsiW-degrading membrane proteinase PrsW (M82 family)
VIAGVLSSLLALLEERIFGALLAALVDENGTLYPVLLYFVVVAGAEESSKYLLLRRRTWHSPEFNCQYDGVVYAVFVALGFALWENISYVMTYGFSTALVRAVTAIPGHACFGVFMGVFYGLARKLENRGDAALSGAFRLLAVLVPALLHGAYDYIASTRLARGGWYFFGFIALLFVVSFVLVGRSSRNDRYID